MFDRIPQNPNRVKITPENGGAAYYATMERADNPAQEGTPLNKATLLKDATAALFGLGADAVPDDVFKALNPAVLFKEKEVETKTGLKNWSVVARENYDAWQSVAYGNGRFVAVGSGCSAYSDDGITWNATSLPSTNYASVTYGNGRFVAVCGQRKHGNTTYNKAYYSEDGINWTAATLPASRCWSFVTYGGGKFVAVAGLADSTSRKTTSAAYSTDGITWTACTLPYTAYWSSVTYGNGTFVAVSEDLGTPAYSTDGITWKGSNTASYAQTVAYGNGMFVLGSNQTSYNIYYSPDGITWNGIESMSKPIVSIGFFDGKFVAVAGDGTASTKYNSIYTSEDGVNWTVKTTIGLTSCYFSDIAYGEDTYVLIPWGGESSTGHRELFYSKTERATTKFVTDIEGEKELSLCYVGSYVGTGATGAAGACTITLPFIPKAILFLRGPGYDPGSCTFNGAVSAFFIYDQNRTILHHMTLYNGSTKVASGSIAFSTSLTGTTFSWWTTSTNTHSAAAQGNASGMTYRYIAFG